MKPRARQPSARDLVADLLAHPPLNDAELARRLTRGDRDEARHEIVDRLFDGSAPPAAFELLCSALLALGVQGEEERLERIAADLSRTRTDRWTALSLIFSASQERAQLLLSRLEPEDTFRLLLQPVADAVSEVMSNPEAPVEIAAGLAAAHPEVRQSAIAYLDEVRRSAGVPALIAYREVLRHDALVAIREAALEAVVREGGAEAAAELARLRDGARGAKTRQAFQRALLRLGTRAIETAPAVVPGRAYLGTCDGQAAFVVLACFENADGSKSIADVCVRADADVRNGFAEAAMSEAAVAKLMNAMRENGLGDLAPLSLAEAAAIVFAGVERTRAAGLPIPDDLRPALLLFERARAATTPPAPPVAAPAPRGGVTIKEARALLALPTYESWFFDAGDLRGAGVEPPSARPRKPRPDWIEGALAGLEASEVAPRLVAMLHHMARWHALRGETERAAICATAAGEARQSFRACAIPRVMLDRSVEVLRAKGERTTAIIGDPEVRDRIRLVLLQGVKNPKGRDLAALDLTEAALDELDAALEALPGSRRPREDDVQRAAFAMATTFARLMLGRRRAAVEALGEEMMKPPGDVGGDAGGACSASPPSPTSPGTWWLVALTLAGLAVARRRPRGKLERSTFDVPV